MYSDRRYSLARYSANRAEKALDVAASFREALGVDAGAAVRVHVRERYAEALQGNARGTVSMITALAARSELHAAISMSANVLTSAALSEILGAHVYGQKDIPALLSVEEALGSRVHGAKSIPTVMKIQDRLTAAAAGAKDIRAALNVSEVLTTMLEATSRTTERAVFQLTIPPGGELRIDSGLYTVLLDGENVLYAQAGDWVGVSRDLLRVTIESASGGPLSGQLIYTERYL